MKFVNLLLWCTFMHLQSEPSTVYFIAYSNRFLLSFIMFCLSQENSDLHPLLPSHKDFPFFRQVITEHHLVAEGGHEGSVTINLVLYCVSVSLFNRPSGLRAGREGGRSTGAPFGGPENLREEEKASQTAHVPQDADEDHRSQKHQRQRSDIDTGLEICELQLCVHVQ